MGQLVLDGRKQALGPSRSLRSSLDLSSGPLSLDLDNSLGTFQEY
jgi:hypothetical protein